MPRASYFAFVFCCLLVLSASTEAAVQYDFVRDGTGEILVSLFPDVDPLVTAITQSSLPVPFEVTEVGESVLVMPAGRYQFIELNGDVIDVGDGYLRSMVPESANLVVNESGLRYVGTNIQSNGNASLSSNPGYGESGAWVRVQNAVPEPASVIVWTFCLAVGSGFGARRRRRT